MARARVDKYVENSGPYRRPPPVGAGFFARTPSGRIMVERVYDLYDDLERQRVMLSFMGGLSPDLITALLDIVERKLEFIELDGRVRRRVFNVVTECLQNLFLHHALPATEGGLADEADGAQGVVMIAQSGTGYSVITGNAMAQGEVSGLKERLDHVNGCDPAQLRDLYKNTLGNGTFGPAGGGGLGLIDMARKSGSKLEYGFVPMDNEKAFFSLNVNVTA